MFRSSLQLPRHNGLDSTNGTNRTDSLDRVACIHTLFVIGLLSSGKVCSFFQMSMWINSYGTFFSLSTAAARRVAMEPDQPASLRTMAVDTIRAWVVAIARHVHVARTFVYVPPVSARGRCMPGSFRSARYIRRAVSPESGPDAPVKSRVLSNNLEPEYNRLARRPRR